MTAVELASHFNHIFGMETNWPDTYEVDPVTYANCCQYVFKKGANAADIEIVDKCERITVWIGVKNKGLMFKNVELILKP